MMFTLKKKAPFSACHLWSLVEFKGDQKMSGPQTAEMLPPVIRDLFESNPDIQSIAINNKETGSIWFRHEAE